MMVKMSQKDKIVDLFDKLDKGERLTLTEQGQYDELFGKGKKPKADLSNWLKKKKRKYKVEKYG